MEHNAIENSEMSLGEILLKNKNKTEKEKLEEENLRLFKENQAHKEKYDSIVDFFEKSKQQITNDILAGKDKIKVSTRKTKMQYGELSLKSGKLEIAHKGNLFKNIWDDFLEWSDKNGLTVKPVDCHDGGGIEGWVELTIYNKD